MPVLNQIEAMKVMNGSFELDGTAISYCIALDHRIGLEKYPFKGGVRFSDKETPQTLFKAAQRLTEKALLFNIPYRGAKAAILINPKLYRNLEPVAEAFTKAILPHLGSRPNSFIPAPDFGVPEHIASVIAATYERETGRKCLEVVTGKPVESGGCPLRRDATGLGASFCIEALQSQQKKLPNNTTVSIVGFGKSTQSLAKKLQELGYRITAISDSSATVISDNLPIDKLINGKLHGQSLLNIAPLLTLEARPCEESLFYPSDLLVLGALSDQITSQNVARIQSTTIIEIANNPITTEALYFLEKKGVFIVPTSIASSGGLFVSYCEWKHDCENKGPYSTDELSGIYSQLQEKMTAVFNKVYQYAEQSNLSLRKAALKLIEDGPLL